MEELRDSVHQYGIEIPKEIHILELRKGGMEVIRGS